MPLEFEGPTRTTSIGFVDARQEYGELLWRERFGATEIESLKRSLGSYAAAGHLQQRPSPAGGGVLKRHWFRFWQLQRANLPPVLVRFPDGSHQSIAALELIRIDELIQSWDWVFKDLETSDYVVARCGAFACLRCDFGRLHSRLLR